MKNQLKKLINSSCPNCGHNTFGTIKWCEVKYTPRTGNTELMCRQCEYVTYGNPFHAWDRPPKRNTEDE